MVFIRYRVRVAGFQESDAFVEGTAAEFGRPDENERLLATLDNNLGPVADLLDHGREIPGHLVFCHVQLPHLSNHRLFTNASANLRAISFPLLAISPTGPTQLGQPDSQAQAAMSSMVRRMRSSAMR